MATQPSEWTYRLTGFPPDVTVTEAESILRSKYGDSCCPSVLSLGLDPYVPGRNVMKVATVSFTEVPEDFLDKKRNQWSVDIVRENSARTKINLIVDTHFLGFTPLNEVKDDAQHKIDVIAVSGLSSHPFGSWKDRGGQFMWLRDALATNPKGARILLYGYDTGLVSSESFQDMDDIGMRLCFEIERIRNFQFGEINFEPRPIVFVAHSLGGLLVKEALCQMTKSDPVNFHCVYGFLFFGVPNGGIEIRHWLPMVDHQPNENLVRNLGPDSIYLRNLQTRFCEEFYFRDAKMVSIYETMRSRTAAKDETGSWKLTGHTEVLVPSHSALRGCPPQIQQRQLPFNQNHADLPKFTSPYQSDYRFVEGFLDEFRRDAVFAIQARFNAGNFIPRSQGLQSNKHHEESPPTLYDMDASHQGYHQNRYMNEPSFLGPRNMNQWPDQYSPVNRNMSRSPLPFGYPNYQRQNELSPGFNNDTQPTTVAQFDPKRGPNPQQPFYMDRNNHRGKIWDSQNIASQTTHPTENPPAYEPRRTTASRAQSPPEGEIKPEESSRDPGSLISLQNKVDLIKTERPSKDEEDTTAAVKYHDIFVRSPPPALTGDNGDEVEESFGLDTLWTAVQEEEKQKARRPPPRTKRLKNRNMTDTREIFNQDNKHEQTDKPKKDNPLACTRCSEQFSSRNALFKHLKASGHDKDDGHDAGDSYSVESTEGHSFKQQKSSVTSTTCSRCNKEFSSRNALFKHLKASQHDKGDDKDTYNQRKATSLTCSRCNKQFNSRNALFKHIRAVGHDGDSDDRDSDDEIVESDEDMGFNLFE